MVEPTQKPQSQGARELFASARAAEEAGDLDRALGFYRGLMQVEPNRMAWPFHAVRVLRRSSRAEEANHALAEALRRWPKALGYKGIQRILPNIIPDADRTLKSLGSDVPDDDALRRPLIEDDGRADVIIGEGRRKVAVLLFTGLADRLLLPLPVFDRYLSELDITAIYLRDPKRIGYFEGVPSLADDYAGTIARLRAMLAERGIERVFTVGNSAGGMAAVSYGIDLGAETVLGFSAPVSLTQEAADRDGRTARFANRIVDKVPAELRDLRGRLERSPGTRVRLFFGAAMPEDRFHAEALDGLDNVTLHPIEGMVGHGALFRVAQTGQLRQVFSETFGAAS